ncbi:MAG: hypothetical protein JMDDDDMK_04310 [Acidobacteria bacterium]|nr:hypothetical protein [Acidobacteriota bacterium]
MMIIQTTVEPRESLRVIEFSDSKEAASGAFGEKDVITVSGFGTVGLATSGSVSSGKFVVSESLNAVV